MSLSADDVRSIARLARLAITDDEIPRYTNDLSNILALIDKMNAVNTKNIEPMAHPQDIAQRLRPDAVTETDQRDYFQSIAPQVEAGLYIVPTVIEHEE